MGKSSPKLIDVTKLLGWLKEEADKRNISAEDFTTIENAEEDEGLRLAAFCSRCGSRVMREVIEYVEREMR